MLTHKRNIYIRIKNSIIRSATLKFIEEQNEMSNYEICEPCEKPEVISEVLKFVEEQSILNDETILNGENGENIDDLFSLKMDFGFSYK